jgi:hypothetical protein
MVPVPDRWIAALAALGIVAMFVVQPMVTAGTQVQVFRENQLLHTLDLAQETRHTVAGRLGPVVIEIASGRARIVEYQSPRMIGTRTGWIQHSGTVAACVPCGILIRIESPPTEEQHDQHRKMAYPLQPFDAVGY